ncbi:hypothetical protein [Gemmatimonas sp.]|jgi:hypothetical protein|uniref:hypothetical protein n=1 Tax=Gemmatimonas sp. TaxID=1962908 RepID=UPI0037BF0FF5
MTRSVVAVFSGFLLIAALSFGTDLAIRAAMPALFDANGRTDSVAVLLLTIGYVGLYATVGCYLAARLAPRSPMRHALVLGGLGLLFNVAGTYAAWDTAPAWYHIVSLVLVMLWAWLGGRMREQETSGATQASAVV